MSAGVRWSRWGVHAGATVLAALLGASAGFAQDSAPLIRIGPITGEAEQGFTSLRGLRELSDGRVLVPDFGEEALYLLTYGESAGVRQIGRNGEGPGEYWRPIAVYALAGDTTLMTDGSSRRWFLLDGADIVETITPQRSPVTERHGTIFEGVSSTLALERVGTSWGERAVPNLEETADSAALLLIQRPWTYRDSLPPPADTVPAEMVGAGPGGVPGCAMATMSRGSGSAAPELPPDAPRMCAAPIQAEDRALLFADGWIAVARLDPYRVDWRTPDGSWVRGPPNAMGDATMTSNEQCAAAQGWDFRGVGGCSADELAEQELPDRHPPFVREGSGSRSLERSATLLAAPDGRVLIRRTPTSRDFMFTRYDVFDRTGSRVGRIQLPADQAILGFGASSIFTVRTDEFDLQWLRRHDWPPPGA